ncbi:unnamed protein product [Ilex paraguariensis]|uniref:Uncharacterized protein n=1 Tax=Ilex paraguariensis TaxID=185542 RepID=A0ABC8RDY1_9AQUA
MKRMSYSRNVVQIYYPSLTLKTYQVVESVWGENNNYSQILPVNPTLLLVRVWINQILTSPSVNCAVIFEATMKSLISLSGSLFYSMTPLISLFSPGSTPTATICATHQTHRGGVWYWSLESFGFYVLTTATKPMTASAGDACRQLPWQQLEIPNPSLSNLMHHGIPNHYNLVLITEC